MSKFNIMAEISGGATGYRQALLKEDGKLRVFDSKDAAQIEANRLTAKQNGPYASATFRYTATKMIEQRIGDPVTEHGMDVLASLFD